MEGRGGSERGRDACYTYSNRHVHSLSPRHVERNYVSRRSIVSRRTRVRNYVRRDVDILRHPDSLTNKLPELVSKLVLSIPVLIHFRVVVSTSVKCLISVQCGQIVPDAV